MRHQNTRNTVTGTQVDGALVQVGGSVGQLTVHTGTAAPGPTERPDAWVAAVRDSGVWRHVPPHRDVEPWRTGAAVVAARLAELRDAAEPRLLDDPWQDPEFPERFTDRMEWLLGEPDPEPTSGTGTGLDLYPAEAALIALLPFLYRVHTLDALLGLRDVEPWDLSNRPAAGERRRAFEAYGARYRLLVQRARLRPHAAPPLGWWLAHRWLVHRGDDVSPTHVRHTLDSLGEAAGALGDVLAPARVARLLHGVRRGPDVCNPDFLDSLPPDEGLRGPGQQRVREQRLALLAASAFALAIEPTALPDVVAEHLGIPHPVLLDQLRDTLAGASLGGSRDQPVLRAACHHEAVIEGLHAYAARVDELLRAVRRTAQERITQTFPALPSHLSSDGVAPAEDAFTSWASFRLDERRVRDLLMGEQLYKDRDLALRELYQNALDACRYRRARTEYLDRSTPGASFAYTGGITFVQDVDADGRAYIECRDNGVGMGEAELHGVFSNAGARFAEQPDFLDEQAAWAEAEPPVRLFPNSRFGIGVLSYFMLADEIRVTTCRMGPTGTTGPLLEASIFGPGHLFRIARLADAGPEPGTTVRLYLQAASDGVRAPSCPRVLRRLLGVAEFATSARHDEYVEEWAAGEFKAGREPEDGSVGLTGRGRLLPWPDAPEGVQLFWCERGGDLLVDGLVVQPSVRGGAVSREPSGLTGLVVNLSGPRAPQRLSADRLEVLDDLRPFLTDVLPDAARHLVSARPDFLHFAWLCRAADGSLVTADLITEECVRQGRVIGGRAREVDTARAGCLPLDASVVRPALTRYDETEAGSLADAHPALPDHVFLWRMLAHGTHEALPELRTLCPELAAPMDLLPALPSDQRLLDLHAFPYRHDPFAACEKLIEIAAALALPARDVAERAALLGLHELPPDVFDAEVPPDAQDTEFASAQARAAIARRRPVSPSGLVREAVSTGSTVAEVARLRAAEGCVVPPEFVECARLAEADEKLSARVKQYGSDWFRPGLPVHPGIIAELALDLEETVPEVCERLALCGLEADGTGLPREPVDSLPALLRQWPVDQEVWLPLDKPVPALDVLIAAENLGISQDRAMDWYTGMGFTLPVPFPSIHPDELQEYIDLLAYEGDEYGYAPAPLRPGDAVPYCHLIEVAQDLEQPLDEIARRLRTFGLTVPLTRPAAPDPLDDELFQLEGPLDWIDVNTDEDLPFAHVLGAARTLLRSPAEITARLTAWGVAVSCPRLPEGLSESTALMLLSGDDDMLLTVADHVDFETLVRKARGMHEPVARVHGWLTALGLDVADPAATVVAALARVPRRRG
ncbi:wHTH domain-containing protein [Streptomyces longispororuber]|uniref:wHTH domain-containing protein n=1 Tax=Streptomyces longispororuber TaxID=68230 RepID=UPI002109A73A|nr:ATP-binding protein [Streptomyces longispororuber]MCQ4209664.1 ATP-binding protein [Streptomyces longispororuber]